jgi:enterobacterial common antigen flippase
LGFHSSNTYFLAKDPTLLSGLSANCLWLSFVLGGGLASLGATFLIQTQLYPGVANEFFWLGAAFAPLSLFFMLGSNILVGLNKIIPYNLLQLGNAVMHMGLVVLAGALGGHVQALLMTAVFGFFLMSIILAAMLRKYGARQWQFDKTAFKSSVKYAFKAYVICLLGFLVLRGNVFLLKRYCTPDEVGYYSIAAQVGEVLGILPQSAAMVLFPNLVKDQEKRWSTTVKTLLVVAGLMVLVCALAALLMRPFVSVAFGSKFLPAVPILYWILPSAYFVALSGILSQFLAAIEFPIQLIVVWALVLGCVFVLGERWIPLNSGIGAAQALSFAHFLLFSLVVLLAIRFRKNVPGATPRELPI